MRSSEIDIGEALVFWIWCGRLLGMYEVWLPFGDRKWSWILSPNESLLEISLTKRIGRNSRFDTSWIAPSCP